MIHYFTHIRRVARAHSDCIDIPSKALSSTRTFENPSYVIPIRSLASGSGVTCYHPPTRGQSIVTSKAAFRLLCPYPHAYKKRVSCKSVSYTKSQLSGCFVRIHNRTKTSFLQKYITYQIPYISHTKSHMWMELVVSVLATKKKIILCCQSS